MSVGASGAVAMPHASLELRLAQRAFAAWIEAPAHAGELREAGLCDDARRTLSALSADDRARCADWLALLIAVREHRAAEILLRRCARADALLVARVRRAVPARAGKLASRAAPAVAERRRAVTSGTSARRERRRM
ncbi:MAG TPA: hypothetical protein VHE32_09930 [Rhodanobacteraceae bacterium]|nr:hypothetical protein [Rhodanobacteraceae bacterium]